MKSFIDEGPTIRIYYDVEGPRRKELVKALGEILLWEPKYLGAPTFSYEVGNYVVTKIGAIICPESCTREIAEQIILKLKEKGFEHTGTNLMLFVVSLPRSMFTEDSLIRLHSLVKSKETLLKAALGARELQIEEYEDKIYFPWFTISGVDGEADAYTKLISALAKTACEQKRISPVERPQENLKYAMRLFLVRLGFVGDEYKQARKILLRDLSGNCSWKAGHAPERRETPDNSNSSASTEEEYDAFRDIPYEVMRDERSGVNNEK